MPKENQRSYRIKIKWLQIWKSSDKQKGSNTKWKSQRDEGQKLQQTWTKASIRFPSMFSASLQLVRASFPRLSFTSTLHKPRWRCALCARWLGSNARAALYSSTANRSLPLLTLSSACQRSIKTKMKHKINSTIKFKNLHSITVREILISYRSSFYVMHIMRQE